MKKGLRLIKVSDNGELAIVINVPNLDLMKKGLRLLKASKLMCASSSVPNLDLMKKGLRQRLIGSSVSKVEMVSSKPRPDEEGIETKSV